MKKLNHSIAILITGLLLFSCSKNNDNSEEIFEPTDANSLIAYYQFNNNLKDSSSNTVEATATSSNYGLDRDNKNNSSYTLDGSADSAINTSDFPLESGSFSISFWLKIDDSQYTNEIVNLGRHIFGTRATCNRSKFFNIIYTHSRSDGDEKIISAEINNSVSGDFSVVATDFPTNVWTHIVYTVDDEAKESKIYFNGTLENTSTWENLNVDVSNTAPLTIGSNVCSGEDGSENITGSNIDDLAIFSSVLTSNQISDLASN